jgi:hypothetical protein
LADLQGAFEASEILRIARFADELLIEDGIPQDLTPTTSTPVPAPVGSRLGSTMTRWRAYPGLLTFEMLTPAVSIPAREASSDEEAISRVSSSPPMVLRHTTACHRDTGLAVANARSLPLAP